MQHPFLNNNATRLNSLTQEEKDSLLFDRLHKTERINVLTSAIMKFLMKLLYDRLSLESRDFAFTIQAMWSIASRLGISPDDILIAINDPDSSPVHHQSSNSQSTESSDSTPNPQS